MKEAGRWTEDGGRKPEAKRSTREDEGRGKMDEKMTNKIRRGED